MVMLLEFSMSVALVGGPGADVALGMLEHGWALFVSNSHRLLLASFLVSQELRESNIFAAVMRGINAPIEWGTGRREHSWIDGLVLFFPEIKGFVRVELPTQADEEGDVD
jgi:hypothetical protein